MNIPEGYKLVKVSAQGIQFGNAWFSHESITGYTADQLNAGTCRVTGGAYMAWLSVDESASVFNEAKERELFELLNPIPGRIEWSFKSSRYIGSSDLYSISNYQSRWEGWKACAKSRARSAE